MPEDSTVQKFCQRVAASKHFENFILLVICISSLALAFESPINDPKSPLMEGLHTLEYFINAIFLLEVFIKAAAMGFIMGDESYLNDEWNILDFSIVLVSLFGYLPLNLDTGIIKVLRCARLIRPLKMISKND